MCVRHIYHRPHTYTHPRAHTQRRHTQLGPRQRGRRQRGRLPWHLIATACLRTWTRTTPHHGLLPETNHASVSHIKPNTFWHERKAACVESKTERKSESDASQSDQTLKQNHEPSKCEGKTRWSVEHSSTTSDLRCPPISDCLRTCPIGKPNGKPNASVGPEGSRLVVLRKYTLACRPTRCSWR